MSCPIHNSFFSLLFIPRSALKMLAFRTLARPAALALRAPRVPVAARFTALRFISSECWLVPHWLPRWLVHPWWAPGSARKPYKH